MEEPATVFVPKTIQPSPTLKSDHPSILTAWAMDIYLLLFAENLIFFWEASWLTTILCNT